MDATTDEFAEAFSESSLRPDWVVTSPPYKNAFSAILKQALRVAGLGVALKLGMNIVEPTKCRDRWFSENQPDINVVLLRAT